MNNYTVYHLHSDYSLLDSCTKFEEYVNKAVELGQKAIASTEHGNIFNWVKKKEYCDSKGIKYIHGCEIYLTHKLYHKRKVLIENKSESYVEIADKKIKDNYHTILLAKNQEGIKEINSLVSKSYNSDYFYFKPRISFDDFLNISDNIISTSACLASPLWSIQETILKNNQEIKISENELQDLINAKEGFKYKSDNSKLEKIKNKIEVLEFNIQEIKKENDSLEYYFDKLLHKYTYLEVQPHINSEKQKKFNKQLVDYHNKYGIPLVAGTDTHSLNDYKAQCRTILQTAKHIEFLDEDTFDLTYKSYEEIYNMFKKQNVLSDDLINEALNNTNIIADLVEDFELDKSFKYPILKSKEEDEAEFVKRCWDKLEEKIKNKIIDINRKSEYVSRINEELSVFKKVGMLGFMLSMSDFIGESRNEGIPFGFSRGSAGGSLCAYLTDINDIDPIIFDTNFARFCNEDRIESGDIDVDVPDEYRGIIFDKIIKKIGIEKTARVFAIGTNQDLGAIDDIGRALDIIYKDKNGKSTKELKIEKKRIIATETNKEIRQNKVAEINSKIKEYEEYNEKIDSPYSLSKIALIKEEYKKDQDKCKKDHKDICYYLDGMVGVNISQSVHPAGIIASPITLSDNYGTMLNDGITVLQLDMDAAHEVGLIKYDILALKTISVIEKTYKYIGKKYPRSYEIDWNDEAVWKDISNNNTAIFQFESSFSGQLLKQMQPRSISDLSLVNACVRPSGESYRNKLTKHEVNYNPDERVANLLQDSYGFLVYQEQQIKFMQQICGLTGSQSDTVRRAIGKKDGEVISKWLPKILKGYCEGSTKPHDVAEKEAQQYIKILEDAASYSFGENHSKAYSMLGYLCGYLRHYYPEAFICAFLNCASNENDILNGTALAKSLGIKIVEPKFRHSKSEYFFDTKTKIIYKGISSIKYMNEKIANELYELRDIQYDTFVDLLYDINNLSIDARKLEILIKLDFFVEFGNANELMGINTMFTFFKHGKAKSISKEKLKDNDLLTKIIERHSNESKTQYTKLQTKEILHEINEFIMSQHRPDFTYKQKMSFQKEFLGYINICTHSMEDKERRKLIILEVIPLKSKTGKNAGKIWAYAISTQSIGSGKNGRFTLMADIYKDTPIEPLDIIFADYVYLKNNYWYLGKYHIIE